MRLGTTPQRHDAYSELTGYTDICCQSRNDYEHAAVVVPVARKRISYILPLYTVVSKID